MPVEVALRDIDICVDTQGLAAELIDFVNASAWPAQVQKAFLAFVASQPKHMNQLNTLFTSPRLRNTCSPLLIFHEGHEQFYIIYTDQSQTPYEPGEPGSILAYLRAYGYEEDVLCSDCYGQLSCSSCAVEIHNGSPENTTPREEEYDMLDVDTDKPATEYTRLGCQTIIGRTPLIVTIRKPACSL